MKQSNIKTGETYLFVATDSKERKHLEGEPFHVVRAERVFRKFRGKGTRKVMRFFNEDGDGARAEELEPMDESSLRSSGYLTDTQGTIKETPEPPDDDLPF